MLLQIFLNFIFNSLWLIYRSILELCISILYSINLLNLYLSSHSISLYSLGFSVKNSVSAANRDSFTFSFTNCMIFSSLSNLIFLVRIAIKMYSGSGKNRNPCLVPDLRKESSKFPH